jgi:hypothetical protein
MFPAVFKFSIVMSKKQKLAVFLYLAPRSLIDIDRRLRGAYSLYHQRQISSETNRSTTLYNKDSCKGYLI